MATLSTLSNEGKHILKWEVLLLQGRCNDRFLYLLPALAEELEKQSALWESMWNIEISPLQQLDALTADYAAGEELAFGRQFKPLVHHGDGVWELKTADLRIFGWFPERDHFVAVRILPTYFVKEHNLYHGLVGEVRRAIATIPLDDPKFVSGEDPNAVISNFYYPDKA